MQSGVEGGRTKVTTSLDSNGQFHIIQVSGLRMQIGRDFKLELSFEYDGISAY